MAGNNKQDKNKKPEQEEVIEEEQEQDTEETTEETESDDSSSSSDDSRKTGNEDEAAGIPRSRLNAVIRERDEARKEAARLKKEQAKKEEQRLAQQNDFKTLYEQAKPTLEKVETLESQIEEYKGVLDAVLQSTLAELPPSARELVPDSLTVDKQLAWIAKNRQTLVKPKAFEMKGGTTGRGNVKPKTKASPEQVEIARQWGIPIEEYMKFENSSAPSGFEKQQAEQETEEA